MMDGEPQRPHLVLPKRKKCKKKLITGFRLGCNGYFDYQLYRVMRVLIGHRTLLVIKSTNRCFRL